MSRIVLGGVFAKGIGTLDSNAPPSVSVSYMPLSAAADRAGFAH